MKDKESIFADLELNVFDETDLDPEDKLIYSKELREAIREEIAKIPIGKIITKILQKEAEKFQKGDDNLKESLSSELKEKTSEVKNEVTKLRDDLKNLSDKSREKHDILLNKFLSFGREKLYFGGPAAMRIQEENGSDLGYPTSLKFSNGSVTVNADGSYSISGGSGSVSSDVYTPTNVTTDRSFDADDTSLDEVADVLGSLIASLQGAGIIQ